MQTFLLACYLCLQLTNLSGDLTKSAFLKKETACDQCLTGLFDNSELLSNIGTETNNQPMTSNNILLEALEERLMFELSRNSMRARVQQKEEPKQEAVLEDQIKKVHMKAEEILRTTESALRTMQENMMDDMQRRSEEMMEQLQRQQIQLNRQLEMLSSRQQGLLMKEVTEIKDNLKQEQKTPIRNMLNANVKLMPNEPLMSENGRYKALLLATGEFVIIDLNKPNRDVKYVGLAGQMLVQDAHLVLEPEGTLTIKNGGVTAWKTPQNSAGAGYNYHVKLENDGQLVVCNAWNYRVWTSGFL